jgi:importin subunit alpha-1
VLCTLLKSEHIEVVEQAIWCLGNMAGDNTRIRDAILYAGTIHPISHILTTTPNLSHSFKRNSSWTLANLCRGKPNPPFSLVKDALPALGKILLEHDSEEIITDILWAFSYVSDSTDQNMHYIT